nr:hypothetical protein [Jiangella alba]
MAAWTRAAGPAGQHLRRVRGTPDDRADVVERHGEGVVQDEREPLRRLQGVEDHQHRQPDGVGEQRLLLRVDPVYRADHRVREPDVQRLLPPRGARPQQVEADPPDDRRQPRAEVAHVAGVGAAEPQPGLLHRVVGFAQRAEHPVGDRAQLPAMRLEPFGQPVHRYLPPSRFVEVSKPISKEMT